MGMPSLSETIQTQRLALAAGSIPTLAEVLDRHVTQYPQRAAFIDDDGAAVSYGELQRNVDHCVNALLATGMRRGDCIAVLSYPRQEVMTLFIAAARLGLLWLGLNPKYQRPELEYIVADAQPSMLVGISEFEGRNYALDIAFLRTLPHRPVKTIELGGVGVRDDAFDISFAEWLTSGEHISNVVRNAAIASADIADPLLLVYTSGSSGKPKGVLLRQRELVRRSFTQNTRFPAQDYPRIINPLPINHIGGMHFLSLYAFIGGGTVYFQSRFKAEMYIRALREGAINVLIALPTMVKYIVDQPDFEPALFGSLEWFIFSGASMPVELLEILNATDCKVGLTYGMTETCGSVTYSDRDASIEVLANTIGRPVPKGEARVADEHGKDCAPGVTGELQVRAEFSMGGYLNRPDATASAYTADGWLRTGDLAELREDGNIRFVGRISEMFKSGGYNVYPREVELAIEQHSDVLLTAVVGVPDRTFSEVGWAFVVAKAGCSLTSEALVSWCRERLANYKIPKRFLLCKDLPLLPVGKVDKQRLRKEATESASF
jgi:long-chain acyl-CoA synthetase